MSIFRFFRKKTFPRGIHPEEHKDTAENGIRRIPFSPEIILLLQRQIPCVKAGDSVYRGQKIADPDGGMSVPLHASVTGTVKAIADRIGQDGKMTPAIILETSHLSSQNPYVGDWRNFEEMCKGEILSAIRETGMVGLGGAGFPTHIKANPPEPNKIHTVIVNGCECEPFLTTDHRVMLESLPELFCGIRIIMKCTGAERAIIGLEDNTPDVLHAIREALPEDSPITVEALLKKYPQGFEKTLIFALLGIELPMGKLPASVGVGVFNVATLAAIGKLLPVHGGLIERVVTIGGPGISRPGNYLIPIGTPLKFVLEHCGFSGTARCVILGGPMMGKTVATLDIPVTKTTSGILAFDKTLEELKNDTPEYSCIRCGTCVQVCPMGLNPCELARRAKAGRYEEMRDSFYLNNCCLCGSCAYHCPSGVPITNLIKTAQEMNRKKQ